MSSFATQLNAGEGGTLASKLQLPLPMNIIILLGVTVLVALIFLVIAVLHYCFWRKPPPPEDPPAFDMNMDYGGSWSRSALAPPRHVLQGGGRGVQCRGPHRLRGVRGQGHQRALRGRTRHKDGLRVSQPSKITHYFKFNFY